MKIPDKWVVVEIDSEQDGKVQRIFAGWYGGYLGSDSWQMNSGIVKAEDCGEYYDFYGESGSVYRCYKQAYGMSRYMCSVYNSFERDLKETGGQATISIVKEYEDASME